MGFDLHCAIAGVQDDALAASVLDHVRSTFPSFVQARRFDAPFAGVIAAHEADDVPDEAGAAWVAHGLATAEEVDDGALFGMEYAARALSSRFADLAFAYVEVDCFGGTCLYGGSIWVRGASTAGVVASPSGHQELFRLLGVVDPPWHFPPFARGFMETGEMPAGPPRREVLCHLNGRLEGVGIAAASVIARTLAPPWKIHVATGASLVLGYGDDDLWLSLHARGEGLELRTSSHLAAETTATLVERLVDELSLRGSLELLRPDGTSIRAWTA